MHRIQSRGLIVFAHDIFMAAVSFAISVYLRLDIWIVEYYRETWLSATALFTVIAAIVFLGSGLYRGVWRYASLNDLFAITRAVSMTVVIFAFAMFIWMRLEPLPRSVLVIEWFVLMALLGGPRFVYRLVKDRQFGYDVEVSGSVAPVRILLVGAGDGAEMFIRALKRDGHAPYLVVGILSESRSRVGREIHGVQVIDILENIQVAVESLRDRGIAPQRLVLTNDNMDGVRVRQIVEAASACRLTLARLPRITDFKAGVTDKLEIKPVAVEDLLGRPQVPLDRAAMARLIAGRKVLITGAGGSIGSELVRQLAELNPAELSLLEQSEFALYRIDQEISETSPAISFQSFIADVRDSDRLDQLISEIRPNIVFHAAALKHVPIVEQNIIEGIATNALGTLNVATACKRFDVQHMVVISTDKAVNPSSVMGATKRLAEIFCQAFDIEAATKGRGTRFITVRFGNVLASTGSVVPLFQRQLENGGPLTVTHPDMSRYFMTIPEAVELVLQAAAHGAGETAGDAIEPGAICVLDMGEPVKIMDLAKQMIRLAGYEPEKDIKIEVIGLRAGEKLFEEIFHGGEPLVATESAGILLAAPRAADINAVTEGIARLRNLCAARNADDALAELCSLVPEYTGTSGNSKLGTGPTTAISH